MSHRDTQAAPMSHRDTQVAAGLINARAMDERSRREKLEAELKEYREQANTLAVRACESDSALERQSRAAHSLRAKVGVRTTASCWA